MDIENSPSQKRALMNVDRLSRLPPEMINKILKHVAVRDVVRTSVLSRFWRYRWTLTQNLVFDVRSIPPLPHKQKMTGLLNVINLVLLLHNGNLTRFEISNYLNRYSVDIDRWLPVLARKSVKKLILEFPLCNPYNISSSLFSCQNLRILKLKGCNLFMPSYAKGFPCLIDLEFDKVTFTNETIASLIVNCPLKRLVLVSCDGFTHINIQGPGLGIFYIYGPCESVDFVNTPSLEYAYIHFWPSAGQIQGPAHNGKKLDFRYALGGLINAEELHLNNYFIKILVTCKVPDKLCIRFPRLSSISIGLNFDDAKEILTAVELLKSSPQLLTMTLNNCSMEKPKPLNERVSLQRELQNGGCTFLTLESVALLGFKGRTYEMSFLRYILANAEVLQTVTIRWEVTCVPNGEVKSCILENMLQFERASPKAKLVFVNQEI